VTTPQRRRRLAFISTLFLLPADAGGKIRTGQILRGMHGGAFEVTLLMPATAEQRTQWREGIEGLCDRFIALPPPRELPRWTRAVELLSPLPANVAHDASAAWRAGVARALRETEFDVVVYDFVHAAVLRPAAAAARAPGHSAPREICFTHNVEAEILERHVRTASGVLLKRLWATQAAKMRRFEGAALRSFDGVIAVSDRDARAFETGYGVQRPLTIPTGVDLDFFDWQAPGPVDATYPPTAVFTASMDSAANIDAVRVFIGDVWPLVLQRRPDARLQIVGRSPPAALVRLGEASTGVSFTGFVDDVRGYVHSAHAFVIPLRVGGGTRLKAFEAMAMGCPVVSTAIGIEGLDVQPGEHFLQCDTADAQAAAVLALFEDGAQRLRLSKSARALVEQRFGHRVAAARFEDICLAVDRGTAGAAGSAAAGVARAAVPA
jgi:glycosyltransferase involved in cell wall biosynthesis